MFRLALRQPDDESHVIARHHHGGTRKRAHTVSDRVAPLTHDQAPAGGATEPGPLVGSAGDFYSALNHSASALFHVMVASPEMKLRFR